MKWLVLFFLLAICGMKCNAQSQIDRSVRTISPFKEFTYNWKDRYGRSVTTRFKVHIQDLDVGESEIKAPLGGKIEFTVTGNQDPDKLLEQELKKRFMRLDGKSGYVTYDYVGIKNRYRAVMKSLALALNQQAPLDFRARIDFVVDFFRSFPYSQTFSGGRDFQSPIGVLVENMGDCDSLSTAFASTMENLGYRVAFVIVPQHLFVAVAADPKKGEQYCTYRGQKFVYLDITSYGLPMGKVRDDFVSLLATGDYTFLY